MFGYIRVLEGELKLNDYALYRGVYCGLCKTMRANTGVTSPLTLTYDFVLLALLKCGIDSDKFTVKPGKCIAHPIKKRPIAMPNEPLKYCAAVSSILTYYKLLDDKNDSDVKKRLVVKTTLGQAKRNMKKALKALPNYGLEELAEKVKNRLDELSALENDGCDSCDRCADVFGMLLADCFENAAKGSKSVNACRELGYRLGRWIYIIDVCDDFHKDLKKDSFNPLVKAGFTSLPDMFLRATLSREADMAYGALKQIDLHYDDVFRILENIICFGMPNAVNKVFEKHTDSTAKLNQSTIQ